MTSFCCEKNQTIPKYYEVYYVPYPYCLTLSLPISISDVYSPSPSPSPAARCVAVRVDSSKSSDESSSPDPRIRCEISIFEISSDNANKLSKNPLWNCAGIVAIEVMKMLGVRSVGLSLSLEKELPLRSGLGLSAASTAAAALAVNEIFGGKLSVEELVMAGFKSEEKVSGYHADNVALALMGGFVLIRNHELLKLIRLSFPMEKELFFMLATS